MSVPPPLSVPSRRRWFPLAWILGLLLLPLTAAISWYLICWFSNSAAVRRLEAKVRQRSEPLTLADLAAKYPSIPDDENAAVPLLEVWEKQEPLFWQAFREGVRPLPPRTGRQFDPA